MVNVGYIYRFLYTNVNYLEKKKRFPNNLKNEKKIQKLFSLGGE
jgi:hypothetical protein